MDNATVINRLYEACPDGIISASEFRGEVTFTVRSEHLVDVARFLRDDSQLQYAFLENLCGVDNLYLKEGPRFTVVYHLFSFANHHRVCLNVDVPEQNPSVPTLTGLWPTANWQEREAYDMFGIIFTGHPAMKRILMPEEWEGHPQRKDVPLGAEEVAFTFNQEEIYAHKIFAKE